jgi:hypothetical protein
MHLYTLLAAAAEAPNTVNYPYLMGLLALIISLVAIIQVAGLRRDFSQSTTPATSPSAAASAPVARLASAAPASDGIAPETVVVIAAAVHAIMGASAKIVAIKPQDSNWGQAGRQSVLSSHKIR